MGTPRGVSGTTAYLLPATNREFSLVEYWEMASFFPTNCQRLPSLACETKVCVNSGLNRDYPFVECQTTETARFLQSIYQSFPSLACETEVCLLPRSNRRCALVEYRNPACLTSRCSPRSE